MPDLDHRVRDDIARIDAALDGKRLGVIGDPWFTESVVADLGERILLLDPNRPHDVTRCSAVLIHSCWPDLPSAWEGELLPTFGPKMERLIEMCNGGADGLGATVPIIYWHLEGGNESCWNTFRHFRDVATVIGTTNSADLDRIEHEQPGKHGLYVPMGASVAIFGAAPRESFANSDGIIFAGRWYGDHSGRRTYLDLMRVAIENAGLGHIFMIPEWGNRKFWPAEYHKYLCKKLTWAGLSRYYRYMRLGLNNDLWGGDSVSMRAPCMMMAGLPVANKPDDLYLYANAIDWTETSRMLRERALDHWRLTERVALMLDEAAS